MHLPSPQLSKLIMEKPLSYDLMFKCMLHIFFLNFLLFLICFCYIKYISIANTITGMLVILHVSYTSMLVILDEALLILNGVLFMLVKLKQAANSTLCLNNESIR